MVNVIGGAYGPLNYFFLALAVVAFVVEAWAFIDAIMRPSGFARYLAHAGKLTKTNWLIILGVAFVLGLYSAAYGGAIGFLSVIAFVAAAVYLVGRAAQGQGVPQGGNTHSGPYGPW